MNPELQEELVQLLHSLNAGVKFSEENLPEFVSQLLQYNCLADSIWMSLMVVIFFILSFPNMFKWYRGLDAGDRAAILAIRIIGFIFLAIPFILLCFDFIKVAFFPEVWLIEYLHAAL